MMWLGLFGAFFGGVLKGWIGEGSAKKLDPLTRKDREKERNRKARAKIQ